jgi:hypothetical protein
MDNDKPGAMPGFLLDRQRGDSFGNYAAGGNQ